MYDCILGLTSLQPEDCYDQDYNDCTLAIFNAIEDKLAHINVTQEYFDAVDNLPNQIKNKFHFARLQKIEKEIFVSTFGVTWQNVRLNPLIKVLVANQNQIGNLDMVLPLYDENHISGKKQYDKIFYSGPIFAVNYNQKEANFYQGTNQFLLYPDSYTIHSEYAAKIELLANLTQVNEQNFFTQQKDKAVFRGGANAGGGEYKATIDTINSHPRFKIMLLSYLFEDYLDARVLGMPPADSKSKQESALGNLYLSLFKNEKNEFMELKDQAKYKYIISLDGHAASWSRPLVILFSKSLLLYQTEYIQWFQPALHPYKHFLPLNYNLSNLLEQISWAKNFPNKTNEIIKNQNLIAKQCFTLEAISEQMVYLLEKYSQKFNYTIQKKNFNKIYP